MEAAVSTNVLPDATEVRAKKRYHFQSSTDTNVDKITTKSKPEVDSSAEDTSVLKKSDSVQDNIFCADIENGAPALKYREIEQTESNESSEYRLDYFCDEILYEIFKYLNSSDLLAVRR